MGGWCCEALPDLPSSRFSVASLVAPLHPRCLYEDKNISQQQIKVSCQHELDGRSLWITDCQGKRTGNKVVVGQYLEDCPLKRRSTGIVEWEEKVGDRQALEEPEGG